MSYINSALRKVQKERDSRYQPYGDIIASRREKRRERSRRGLVFLGSLLGMGIVLVVSLVAYNRYRPAGATVRTAVPATKITVKQLPSDGYAERLAKGRQLYEEALTAQRGKRWAEAERFYQQALSYDPRHVKALNNLGVIAMSNNRYEEAIELFIKAVAAQEDYVDPYYNLACVYAQLGNSAASLRYLERAVNIDGSVREWANADAEFTKLRRLPEYKKIMAARMN